MIHSLEHVIQDAGAWGPAAFVLAYALLTIGLVPASPMTILGGALFGFEKGLLLTVCGAVIGADSAFFLARTILRRRVERWIEKHRTFVALDSALAEHEVKVQALLRLSPVFPFFLLNYILGASSVTRRSYLWTTAVFIIPSTALYVYLGTEGRRIADGLSGPEIVYQVVGIAITAFSIWFIGRIARRALERVESESVT